MKKLIASSLVIASLLAGGLTIRPAFADSCCKASSNAETSKKSTDKCDKDMKSCCKSSAAKTTKTQAKTAVKAPEAGKDATKK